MRALDDPIAAMTSDGLVPLLSSSDPNELLTLARTLVDVGISTLEVTLRQPGSLEAFQQLVAVSTSEGLPLAIGAGTVLDVDAAESAMAAGARFVFSPVVSSDVAARCRQASVTHIPGCATPTEVHTAMRLGCGTVKLFPADTIGGPSFLRSLRSVLPDVVAIPSGGIGPDPSVIRPWFEAGAAAVAMGSRLLSSETLSDPGLLRDRLIEAQRAVSSARGGLPQ